MQDQDERAVGMAMPAADTHEPRAQGPISPRWLTALGPAEVCAYALALGFIAYRFFWP